MFKVTKSKKLDDNVSKLLKHGSRLHQLYNSYLIAVDEYNKNSDLYVNSLLPNLMESYQATQEKLLEE